MMSNFKKIAFAVAMLFTQYSEAQFMNYGNGNFWVYTDGSVYAGLSMIKIDQVKPVPGFTFQYETGTSHFKVAFSLLTTLYKADAGTRKGSVVSKMTGDRMYVPFDVSCGYFSVGGQFRYYVFDTEEASGHNFFAGLGVGGLSIKTKYFNGQYDKTLYKPEDPFMFGKDVKEESDFSLGFNFGAGYQYTFDSGLTLFSSLNYDKSSAFDFGEQYFERIPANALNINAGVKYVFEYGVGPLNGLGY